MMPDRKEVTLTVCKRSDIVVLQRRLTIRVALRVLKQRGGREVYQSVLINMQPLPAREAT